MEVQRTRAVFMKWEVRGLRGGKPGRWKIEAPSQEVAWQQAVAANVAVREVRAIVAAGKAQPHPAPPMTDYGLNRAVTIALIAIPAVAVVVGVLVVLHVTRQKPPRPSGKPVAIARTTNLPSASPRDIASRPALVARPSIAASAQANPIIHPEEAKSESSPQRLAAKLEPFAKRLPNALEASTRKEREKERKIEQKVRAEEQAADNKHAIALPDSLIYVDRFSVVRSDVIKIDSAIHPLAGLVVLRESEDITDGNTYRGFRVELLTLTVVIDDDHWRLSKATEVTETTSEAMLNPDVDDRPRQVNDVTSAPFVTDAVRAASSVLIGGRDAGPAPAGFP
jgi:hypothetical protein